SVFSLHGSAATQLYTLSLHDALPICRVVRGVQTAAALMSAKWNTVDGRKRVLSVLISSGRRAADAIAYTQSTCSTGAMPTPQSSDRKSTRLNSSHDQISYAVFCLKKK